EVIPQRAFPVLLAIIRLIDFPIDDRDQRVGFVCRHIHYSESATRAPLITTDTVNTMKVALKPIGRERSQIYKEPATGGQTCRRLGAAQAQHRRIRPESYRPAEARSNTQSNTWARRDGICPRRRRKRSDS